MSTQLHLLAKPERAGDEARAGAPTGSRPLRARRSSGRNRRPVHWQGQWSLDDRTRSVGQAGVASARAALARAGSEATDSASELRQAS